MAKMWSLFNERMSSAIFLVATLLMSSVVICEGRNVTAAASPSVGQDVLLDPARSVIYSIGASGDDLRFVNSSTGETIGSIAVGPGPSSICLSKDGALLYVAIPSYKCIVIVDANSRAITGNISLSFFPLSVRLDGAGFMYVSGCGDNARWIYSIDMRTWKVKNSVAAGLVGDLVIEISPDGATLLAMELGISPHNIFRYGVNAGVFTSLDVDNHDLGGELRYESVDWARGKIYIASGYPYGIEVVSISTLDYLGDYPMYAYASCVAMSSDGRYLYGSADDYISSSKLWMFNASDGSPMGSIPLPGMIDHLVIGHDLRNAYVNLPFQRIALVPVIELLYPTHGTWYGYTPTYLGVGVAGGLPRYARENVTVYLMTAVVTLETNSTDGIWWTFYRGNYQEVPFIGAHYLNVSIQWLDQTVWGNATYTVAYNVPTALQPSLRKPSPPNQSIQPPNPTIITADIVYPTDDWIALEGGISLDDVALPTILEMQTLVAYVNETSKLGWHNVTAHISWEYALGTDTLNWQFRVMMGPLLEPIFPARNQVLTEMPDHIEVSVDARDAGPDISAPQLYLDGLPIMTLMTQNDTIRGTVSSTLSKGTHSAAVTLNWIAGRARLDWDFELNVFTGPYGEVLVRYQYKHEFSLLIPSNPGWTLEEDEEVSGEVFPVVMYGPTSNSFRTNILISSTEDSLVEESEDYLQEQLDIALEDLEQSGMPAILLGTPHIRTIDNHTAYLATIQLENYDIYQSLAIIASEDHGMVWVVILSASGYQFYAYSEMFDEIVNSFRIEMKVASHGSALEHEIIGLGMATIVGGTAGLIVWLTRRRRPPISLQSHRVDR